MNKRNKIYISGPISGIENENRPAFSTAEAELKRLGLKPISPFACEPLSGEADPVSYSDYMRRDILVMVRDCDKIYMLDGWMNSKGARLEHSIALVLGWEIQYEFKESQK